MKNRSRKTDIIWYLAIIIIFGILLGIACSFSSATMSFVWILVFNISIFSAIAIRQRNKNRQEDLNHIQEQEKKLENKEEIKSSYATERSNHMALGRTDAAFLMNQIKENEVVEKHNKQPNTICTTNQNTRQIKKRTKVARVSFRKVGGQLFNTGCSVFNVETGKLIAKCKQGETISIALTDPITIKCKMSGSFGSATFTIYAGKYYSVYSNTLGAVSFTEYNPTIRKAKSSNSSIGGKAALALGGMLLGAVVGEAMDIDDADYEDSFDTDDDGIDDAFGYDTDGDGDIDTIAMDSDGDGDYDTFAQDTDNDGCIDTISQDTNNDGTIDIMESDIDGDGIIETSAYDKDGDGKIDTIFSDYNNDGNVDTISYDSNNDGSIDTIVRDINFDGKADIIGTDTNSDGTFDKVVADRNTDGYVDYIAEDSNNNGSYERIRQDNNFDGRLETISKDFNDDGIADAAGIDLDNNGNIDIFHPNKQF